MTSANTKLIRADKAWTQWLVASVLEFIAKQEVREHPSKEAAGEWVGRLLAASSTSVGRRIARKVRCELARQHGIRSTEWINITRHTNLQCSAALSGRTTRHQSRRVFAAGGRAVVLRP